MTISSRLLHEFLLSLINKMACNDDFSRREDIFPFVAPPANLSALRKYAPENYGYTGINAFIVPCGAVILIACGDMKSCIVIWGVLNQNNCW